MKKDIIVTFNIIDETTLHFYVVDTTNEEMTSLIGDIETVQSHLIEMYIPSEIKVYTMKTDLGRVIGQSIEQVGLEVAYLTVHLEE